jgi:DNA polymerase
MKTITLDFETYYDSDYSLSKLTTEAYIRDLRFETIGVCVQVGGGEKQWFSGDDFRTQVFLEQFDWANSALLCHNTMFDGAILAWRYGIRPKFYLDTLSMARPVTGQTVGGSLKRLAELFAVGVKGDEVVKAIGKRRKDFTPEEMERYGSYCQNDTQLTTDLFKTLYKYTTKEELQVIDMMLRMFIDPVLELDYDMLTAHLTEVRAKRDALIASLTDGTGMDHIMSNPKFAGKLMELGVDPPMKTSLRTGKQTFAFSKQDVAFTELLHHDDERVQILVAARLGLKSTIEESRTQAFLDIWKRGQMPFPLTYWAAHTGRAGGADNINMQNLPRGGALRRAIVAPEGHSIVAGDSSQIEARTVAWLAGQTDLVAAFAAGVDIYSDFAASIYNKPINKKDTPLERHVGKTAILGLGYGMGADKFQFTLKVGKPKVEIEQAEAKRVVNLYRNKYSRIVDLWRDADNAIHAMLNGDEYWLGVGIKLRCTQDGVHLPNGMMIRYANLRREGDDVVFDMRKGPTKLYAGRMVENIVQALARIVVFQQMLKIHNKLVTMDNPEGYARFRVVGTVHDENITVVPTAVAERMKAFMEKVMSTAPVWAPGLPVACEVGVGQRYGSAK